MVDKVIKFRHWVYTALFLVVGLCHSFLMPPFEVADENMHFFRAWQLSEGIVFADIVPEGNFYGRHIPNSLAGDIPESFLQVGAEPYTQFVKPWQPDKLKVLWQLPLDEGKRQNVLLNTTGSYAPACYVPQIAGAWLGRLMSLTAGQYIYLMRLCGLCFASLCLYISMRLVPFAAGSLFLIAMLPMFSSQCASLSADAVVLPVCMVTACYFYFLGQRGQRLSGREMLFLALLAVWLGLAKAVYGALMLLYFALPCSVAGSRRKFFGTGIFLCLLALGTAFIWPQLTLTLRHAALPSVTDADAAAQIAIMREHPLIFVKAAAEALRQYGSMLLRQGIGILGWLTVKLPEWFYAVYGIALCIMLFHGSSCNDDGESIVTGSREADKHAFMCRWRALSAMVIVAACIAIMALEYVYWTAPGSEIVEGLQGRYFLPFLVLSALALPKYRLLRQEMLITVPLAILSGFTGLFCLYRYYCF